MAWIELHDTLPDHAKVMIVAEALNMDKDLVVGKLVRLWTWAVNNREDGAFRSRDIDTIAEVMRFKGKPQRLVTALVDARLLDQIDDTYVIHDWDERVGMLLAQRELKRTQTRERVRKHRAKRSTDDPVTESNALQNSYVTETCNSSNAGTVPKPYQDINTPSPAREETAQPQRRFIKPTVEEVASYCKERNNSVDAQRFYDFYEAKGWQIGKTPMKDWQASVRTWEGRDAEISPSRTGRKSKIDQHNKSDDDLSHLLVDLDMPIGGDSDG